MKCRPRYLDLHASGELTNRARDAVAQLESCGFCPRRCGANRVSGELGRCQTGRKAWVSSYNPHFGEEAPLVGRCGSGTIFFAHCNLGCLFCQNYEISHCGDGTPLEDRDLARVMLVLQDMGCHNINLVTPSHVVPQILSALPIAVEGGLCLPLVYNSSAYDGFDTLRLLDGIIDIYMPDFKFWSSLSSAETCDAPDYPEVARTAIKEMHRQVGDLVIEGGIAHSGVILRHLLMPAGLDETRQILNFIRREISANTYVNLMPQYRPCGCARQIARLAVPLCAREYDEALDVARAVGIHRLDSRRTRFLML